MTKRYPGRTRETMAALDLYMARTGHERENVEQGLEDMITDLLHLSAELQMNTLHSLQRATLVFCDEASEKEKI